MANIAIFGKEYLWDEQSGLDPQAVLGIQPWIQKQAMRYIRRAKPLGTSLEDLVQAGNVGALAAAKTFRPHLGASFLTWACFAIRNEMLRLCAQPRATSLDSLACGGPDAPAIDEILADGRDSQESAEAELELGILMSKLSPKDMLIVCLRYGLGGRLRGMTFAAIGKEMGLSDQTVCNRVKRALAKMRKAAKCLRLARSA
jgi:RNA polymerase sigma factor (sigma-70 family)